MITSSTLQKIMFKNKINRKCKILEKLQVIIFQSIPIAKKVDRNKKKLILQKYHNSFWVIDINYKVRKWTNHFTAKQP